MKDTSAIDSSWSLTQLQLFVDPSWSLNVTHGEMMSRIAVPRWAMAALIRGTTCLPSPLKERATNEQPSASATAHGSIGWNVFTAPFFCTEPRSAVAENWPLVNP